MLRFLLPAVSAFPHSDEAINFSLNFKSHATAMTTKVRAVFEGCHTPLKSNKNKRPQWNDINGDDYGGAASIAYESALPPDLHNN